MEKYLHVQTGCCQPCGQDSTGSYREHSCRQLHADLQPHLEKTERAMTTNCNILMLKLKRDVFLIDKSLYVPVWCSDWIWCTRLISFCHLSMCVTLSSAVCSLYTPHRALAGAPKNGYVQTREMIYELCVSNVKYNNLS